MKVVQEISKTQFPDDIRQARTTQRDDLVVIILRKYIQIQLQQIM